jgi:hypothetical protein
MLEAAFGRTHLFPDKPNPVQGILNTNQLLFPEMVPLSEVSARLWQSMKTLQG